MKDMDTKTALESASTSIKVKFDPSASLNKASAVESLGEGDSIMVTFFQLNPADVGEDLGEKLMEIKEWAIRKGGVSEMEALDVLRDLRFRLSTSDPEKIHRYIKLRKMAEEKEMEAKAMEN